MIHIFILYNPTSSNIDWNLQYSEMRCGQNMLSTPQRFCVLGSCINLWPKSLCVLFLKYIQKIFSDFCVPLGLCLEKSDGVQYL